MKKTIGTLMLLTLAVLTGCEKERLVDDDSELSENIRFNISADWDKDEIITKTSSSEVGSAGVNVFASIKQGSETPRAYFDDVKLTSSGSSWTSQPTYYWANANLDYDFFAVYPYNSSKYSFDGENRTVQFTVNESDNTDYLWAHKSKTNDGTDGTAVQLDLEHAMSQVTFVLNNTHSYDLNVTSAYLRGQGSTATFTIGASGASFDTPTTSGAYYEPNVSKTIETGTNDEVILQKYVIPQTVNNNTKFTINYTENSQNLSKELTIKDHTATWVAGEKYTYSMTIGGTVTLTLSATLSSNMISNVVITNTSNVKAFIRAAITLNWYDNSGNIVTEYQNTDGTFTGLPGSGWTASGGFYKCTSSVNGAGATTGSLFTNYTIDNPTRVSGATLKMTIIVQAIADTGQANPF